MPLPKLSYHCVLRAKSGNDIYGQAVYGASKTVMCAIVKLKQARAKTSVRTGASGTQGHAEELTADAVLLMNASDNVGVDDYISVAGRTLKVLAISDMYDVHQNLDHVKVECSIE